MPFRSVFIAVTISGALLLAALLINNARPASEVGQPRPELVRATGRCAQCHREETPAVVHQFEERAQPRHLHFDFWHYFGLTAKHGAFMGGADFVQWHANYELLLKLTELEEMAGELRNRRAAR